MRPKVRGTCEGSLGLLPPGSDPVRNLAAPRARPVYPPIVTVDTRRTQCLIVARSMSFRTLGGAPGWGGGLPAKYATAVVNFAPKRRPTRAYAAFAARDVS